MIGGLSNSGQPALSLSCVASGQHKATGANPWKSVVKNGELALACDRGVFEYSAAIFDGSSVPCSPRIYTAAAERGAHARFAGENSKMSRR